MTTSTTKIGRLGLAHADFGFDAGTPLHTALRDMYTRISDNVNSRLLKAPALADAASIDIEHGLQCAFSELRVLVYTYDTGTGELTRVNPATGYTLAASPNNPPTTTPTTHLRLTNGTGSLKNVALVVVQGRGAEKLDDLDDVDLTTPAEDGQALVWDAVAQAFKPGASGDASFKLQGIVDPTATIKGGYLMLPDGRELATHDGAGDASTDFGKDIAVNLDTILGGNPANATAYYLAIDLNTLGAAVVQTDTGRKVYAITEANLVLTTTTPEAANRTRYLFRSFVRSADAGTVWSGAGAAFGTLAFLQQPANVPAQSPLVYTFSQVVGTVGATGQVRQGHVLEVSSFPTAAQDAAKLSLFGLDSTPNGKFGGRNLTAYGTPAYTTGVFGASNEAVALVRASTQHLSAAGSETFFQPYGNSFSVGGWFKATGVVVDQGLLSRTIASGNLWQWFIRIYVSKLGFFAYTGSDGAGQNAATEIADLTGLENTWFHVAIVWDGTTIKGFFNGKQTLSCPFAGFANVAPEFAIGRWNGTNYFGGSVDEVFYVKGVVLTDIEVAKVASTKLTHNKAMAASRQLWMGRHYAGGVSPVSDLSGFVLDMVGTNEVFVDLSGCDPADKVDLMLMDSGAAGAISVPVQTPEFLLTANIPGAGLDTNLAEDPRSIQGWQKDNDSHWQPLDLVGLVYLDAADGMKLKGDLSSLAPSVANPIRIVVSTTASAQAVGAAGQTQSGLVSSEASGTFTMNCTGPLVAKNCTVTWNKVGKLVTLNFSETINTGASSASGIAMNAANVPSFLRPAASKYFVQVAVVDAGADVAAPGMFASGPTGNFSVNKTATGGFTSASSNCGFYSFSVSYLVP